MRIVFYARSKSRTGTTGFIEAALRRAGHVVLRINERRLRRSLGGRVARATVLRATNRFRPDFVLIHSTDAAPATLETLVARHRTVMFTPDCWRSVEGEPLERARKVDLLLTVARGQVPELRSAGVHAEWLPEACEPVVHAPAQPEPSFASEVAFIGKLDAYPWHAARRELLRAVAARFDTALYGAGWENTGLEARRAEVLSPEYAKVCAGATIVLGRDWTDACEGYFSNRTWFTLGCGGFLLTNYVPGLERIFTNRRELVWYHDVGECLDLIEHYIARPEERREISEAGRAYVLAHRTYDHFARDLVALARGRPLAFPPAARTDAHSCGRLQPDNRIGRERRTIAP